MTDEVEWLGPCHVNSRYDAIGNECQMMGHTIGEIRVLLKGHNDPSNMSDLRGIGESLMFPCITMLCCSHSTLESFLWRLQYYDVGISLVSVAWMGWEMKSSHLRKLFTCIIVLRCSRSIPESFFCVFNIIMWGISLVDVSWMGQEIKPVQGKGALAGF